VILGAVDTDWLPRGWAITDRWTIPDYAYAESFRVGDYVPPVGTTGFVIERKISGKVETDQVFVEPSGRVLSASGTVGIALTKAKGEGKIINPPPLEDRSTLAMVLGIAAPLVLGSVLSIAQPSKRLRRRRRRR
jgi:hypothetical protein